jgi:hypothetical protein
MDAGLRRHDKPSLKARDSTIPERDIKNPPPIFLTAQVLSPIFLIGLLFAFR